MFGSLPSLETEVEIFHPLFDLPLFGKIVCYTCSEDFKHPDGANIKTSVGVIECPLYEVTVDL